MHASVIYNAGPPKPYNVTITANLESDTLSQTLEAYLQWNVTAYNNFTGNFEYFITVWPPVKDGSSFTTANKSLLLSHLLYDKKYSIGVITSNCIGNSTPANISIGEYNITLMYTITLNL